MDNILIWRHPSKGWVLHQLYRPGQKREGGKEKDIKVWTFVLNGAATAAVYRVWCGFELLGPPLTSQVLAKASHPRPAYRGIRSSEVGWRGPILRQATKVWQHSFVKIKCTQSNLHLVFSITWTANLIYTLFPNQGYCSHLKNIITCSIIKHGTKQLRQ